MTQKQMHSAGNLNRTLAEKKTNFLKSTQLSDMIAVLWQALRKMEIRNIRT